MLGLVRACSGLASPSQARRARTNFGPGSVRFYATGLSIKYSYELCISLLGSY